MRLLLNEYPVALLSASEREEALSAIKKAHSTYRKSMIEESCGSFTAYAERTLEEALDAIEQDTWVSMVKDRTIGKTISVEALDSKETGLLPLMLTFEITD
jgi:hypothetical protein